MTTLGHIVLYVKDLQESIRFYVNIVGLDMQGMTFNGKAAVLSGGSTHHELMLIEVGEAPGPLQGKRIGVYHSGWKIGNHLHELRALYHKLKDMDYPIHGQADHTISQSLYLYDPDGNEVELYVDNPDYDWSINNDWMQEPVKSLNLD